MLTLLAMDGYTLKTIINPIGICVVLPIVIAWLVNRRKTNETNRRAEILLKALELGSAIDLNLLQEPQKPRSIKEKLLNRLTAVWIVTLSGLPVIAFGIGLCYMGSNNREEGLMFAAIGGLILAVGIALFCVYFAGKKLFVTELGKETESQEHKQS